MSGAEPAPPTVFGAADALRCPEDGSRLRLVSLVDFRAQLGAERPLAHRRSGPVRLPDWLLVRADGKAGYPIIEGIPLLLVPEMIGVADEQNRVDIADARYAEAYEEMAYYNQTSATMAEAMESTTAYRDAAKAAEQPQTSFPEPLVDWLDERFDSLSQRDAYRHIAPIAGQRVLQLGGKGLHAVKFLLAGAREAWCSTPMHAEAAFAHALADRLGVGDRLSSVVSIAEELPFPDDFFDVVYSGHSVHHMITELAFPEIHRVLAPGGRFAATDPFQAPLYDIGTRVFGKRESVYCRPLTAARLAPLATTFDESRIEGHGAIVRYPLLALQKVLRVEPSMGAAIRIAEIEDRLARRVHAPARWCSSVAVTATKSADGTRGRPPGGSEAPTPR